MEYFFSVFLGLGLAAAAGFRIFLPLLVTNIASLLGWYQFSPELQWMGRYGALAIFGTATLAEISAYYIPWLDNILDSIAMPASVVAGTVLATSWVNINDPALKWALGLILGGGTAGVIQAGTSIIRLGSSTATGGVANAALSTFENIMSFIFSILALLLPVFMALVAVFLVLFLIRKKWKTKAKA